MKRGGYDRAPRIGVAANENNAAPLPEYANDVDAHMIFEVEPHRTIGRVCPQEKKCVAYPSPGKR